MEKSFLFAHISIQELKSLSSWTIREKENYWQIDQNLAQIYLAKRDFYPQTFILQGRGFWVLGYIEPSLYPQLEKQLVRIQGLYKFITQVREKLDKEFLIIVLDQKTLEIRVYRDALCTIPIFYLEKKDSLLFSNEFTNLLSYLAANPRIDLDFKTLSEHLLTLEGSPQKTVFARIRCLTERSLLVKNKNGIRVKYPFSWPVLPKLVSPKKPVSALTKILEKTLDNYWAKFQNGEEIGFEVSGGIDSAATLGFYTKKSNNPLRTFSMLLSGTERTSQKEKLNKLGKHFGLKMNITPVDNLFSLKSQLKSQRPFYPVREIYFEALNKMAQNAQKEKINVIFTGMGGDEAFIIDPREDVGHQGIGEAKFRQNLPIPSFFSQKFKQKFLDSLSLLKEDNFPTPVIPQSVLDANVSRNNIYVAHGIWPVAPLASPYFIKFCRSLPKKLRNNKKILREYQKKQGYPETIYDPKINENFGHFFESSIRKKSKNLLMQLFNDSLLSELGLIKKKNLIENYLAYTQGENNLEPLYFYSIAVIEILLRSINKRLSTSY